MNPFAELSDTVPAHMVEACDNAYSTLFENTDNKNSFREGNIPSIEQVEIVEFKTPEAAMAAMDSLDGFHGLNGNPAFDHYIDEVDYMRRGNAIILRSSSVNALAYVRGYTEETDPEAVINYRS